MRREGLRIIMNVSANGLLVNIGCGSTWHPAWVNLDVRPVSPGIRSWNVADGLPFADGQVQACYASHVLEHLSRHQARTLLAECWRVLRPGGVLRLAVPDLETLAREYLKALASTAGGDPSARRRHEWMTIELLDQMVRTESGGDMAPYLERLPPDDVAFIRSRIGSEADGFIPTLPKATAPSTTNGFHRTGPRKALETVKALAKRLGGVGRSHDGGMDRLAICLSAMLFGERGKRAMQEGLFRQSGESHRWMYDRVSLAQVLQDAGFGEVRACTAFESWIEGFEQFGLDVVGGKIRKPDSLFMEGKRI